MINLIKKIIKSRILYKNNIKFKFNDIDKISLKANIGMYCEIGAETVVSTDVILGEYTFINMRSIIRSANIGRFCL